jgi:hypothetical protein
MRIQKQLSNKMKNKNYYKYALVIPSQCVKESNLEGYELEAEANDGEIKIRKKKNNKSVK